MQFRWLRSRLGNPCNRHVDQQRTSILGGEIIASSYWKSFLEFSRYSILIATSSRDYLVSEKERERETYVFSKRSRVILEVPTVLRAISATWNDCLFRTLAVIDFTGDFPCAYVYVCHGGRSLNSRSDTNDVEITGGALSQEIIALNLAGIF